MWQLSKRLEIAKHLMAAAFQCGDIGYSFRQKTYDEIPNLSTDSGSDLLEKNELREKLAYKIMAKSCLELADALIAADEEKEASSKPCNASP